MTHCQSVVVNNFSWLCRLFYLHREITRICIQYSFVDLVNSDVSERWYPRVIECEWKVNNIEAVRACASGRVKQTILLTMYVAQVYKQSYNYYYYYYTFTITTIIMIIIHYWLILDYSMLIDSVLIDVVIRFISFVVLSICYSVWTSLSCSVRSSYSEINHYYIGELVRKPKTVLIKHRRPQNTYFTWYARLLWSALSINI